MIIKNLNQIKKGDYIYKLWVDSHNMIHTDVLLVTDVGVGEFGICITGKIKDTDGCLRIGSSLVHMATHKESAHQFFMRTEIEYGYCICTDETLLPNLKKKLLSNAIKRHNVFNRIFYRRRRWEVDY